MAVWYHIDPDHFRFNVAFYSLHSIGSQCKSIRIRVNVAKFTCFKIITHMRFGLILYYNKNEKSYTCNVCPVTGRAVIHCVCFQVNVELLLCLLNPLSFSVTWHCSLEKARQVNILHTGIFLTWTTLNNQ